MTNPAGVLCVLVALGLATGATVWGWHWKSLMLSDKDAQTENQALAYLEEEVDFLRDENDRLLSRIYEIETGGGAEMEKFYRPLEIEARVAEIRGLKFKEDVIFEVVEPEVIEAAVQKRISASYDDHAFDAMSLAWGVIGFTEPMMNLQYAWITVSARESVYYDSFSRKVLVRKEVDPENPFDVPELAREICLALLDQHGANLAEVEAMGDNMDSGLARRAFYRGQAALVSDVVSESTLGEQSLSEMPLHDSQNPINLVAATPVPDFIRQVLTFPSIDGVAYCVQLRDEAGGFAIFDEMQKQGAIPQATRMILDGAALDAEQRAALSEKFVAASPLGNLRLRGTQPIFVDTAGQFGMRSTIETFLGMAELPEPSRVDDDPEEIAPVAEGWLADRYAVFATGEQELSVIWESRWESAQAAESFVTSLTELADIRYGMTPGETMERSDAFRFQKIFRPRPTRVVMIDAQTKNAVAELEKAYGERGK